jgi:hypothetical protein
MKTINKRQPEILAMADKLNMSNMSRTIDFSVQLDFVWRDKKRFHMLFVMRTESWIQRTGKCRLENQRLPRQILYLLLLYTFSRRREEG